MYRKGQDPNPITRKHLENYKYVIRYEFQSNYWTRRPARPDRLTQIFSKTENINKCKRISLYVVFHFLFQRVIAHTLQQKETKLGDKFSSQSLVKCIIPTNEN